MKKILLSILAIPFLLGASVDAMSKQKNMVGILRMSSSADGCGCYFSFNKADDKARRLMFFASDQDMGIWINIDGRDTRLRLIRETKPNGRIRVGSKFVSHYGASDITVDLVQVATWVCPPRDESCEVAKYSATFAVRKGSRTEIVRAVGSCGC